LWWLVAGVLLVLACEPEEDPRYPKSAKGADSTQSQQAANDPQVDLLCGMIVKGDFENADKILAAADVSRNGRLAQLNRIVDTYEDMRSKRQTATAKALKDEEDKLKGLHDKYGPDAVVDVNDIGEVMAVAIKTRGYAGEKEKEAIMQDAFVKRVIATALDKGRELDAKGEWIDAYAGCYYWLVNLDEDNAEYKELAELMGEKALIEMALKDDSCGQTSKERHEGIRSDMVIRAIRALEINYVEKLDYTDMARKGLKRCHLLAEVLTKTTKQLDYAADPDHAAKWDLAIDSIEKELAESPQGITNEKFRMIFGEVLALNSITLGVDEEIVIAQFAEAAFSSLDPHTTLVWPWQVKDFQKMITKQFIGIGVEISKATGKLKVVSLLPDTPAYKSGLDAGDEILEVNGESTVDMSIICAVSKITGPKGTDVTLTIRHEGSDKTQKITIVRDRIVVPPIRGWQRADNGEWNYIVDEENRLGYIRITDFTETTATDMDEILAGLEKGGLNGLIIDLRFNSGGYLVTAAAVVDMFVEKGVIVRSQPRSGFATTENAHKEGTHPNYPMVVLINGQSASASEIVAGALQDPKFQRATLVGTRSYGKGSVQVITPYTGGDSQLKYTMAYYHLPSGQRVKNRYMMEKEGRKDWGIEPDVEVELSIDELREMVDVQRDNEILVKADHDNKQPVERHSLAKTLEADKQLAVGVLVLQSKMIQAGGTVKFENQKHFAKEETVAGR
jgi:carboxyl-terminal processing protease